MQFDSFVGKLQFSMIGSNFLEQKGAIRAEGIFKFSARNDRATLSSKKQKSGEGERGREREREQESDGKSEKT